MGFRKPEEIRRHLHSQRSSGLTIAAYCRREGISQNTFFNWRKRFAGDRSLTSAAVPPRVSFLHVGSQPTEGQRFEFSLPNGAGLTAPISCDMDVLRQAVRLLAPLRPR